MATFGFLDRFQQAKDDAEAQIRGQLNALKGQNGRMGAQEALAAPTSTTQPPAQQSAQQPAQPVVTPALNKPDIMPTGEQAAQMINDEASKVQQPAQQNADDELLKKQGEDARSEYSKFSDDILKMLEAPLTVEEQRKRERAAHAIEGIGQLGNVLSSFSNLAFAGQAPSQTLPRVPEASPAVDKERARWDRVRKDYVTSGLQRAKGKYDLWKDAVTMKRAEDNQAWQKEYQRRSLELREAQNARLTEKMHIDRRIKEGKLSLDEARLELQRKKLEIDEAYKNGLLSVAQYRNAIQEWQTGINEYNAIMNASGTTRESTTEEQTPLGPTVKKQTVVSKKNGSAPPPGGGVTGRSRKSGSGGFQWTNPQAGQKPKKAGFQQ